MRRAVYGIWCLAAVATQVAAQVPREVQLWGREPVEQISSRRGEVCLNGVWRFAPATRPAATQPFEDCAYIRVPGDWRNTGARPGIVSTGKGAFWSQYKGDAITAAWYERTFMVPADWSGRSIMLDFQRVSTDAVVFVNGRRCGAVRWPGGEVDITAAVTPGQQALVRVLAAATASEAEADAFAAGGDATVLKDASPLESRGIIGDVVLCCRPRGAHVSDVFVQTSTRRKRIDLSIELTGIRQEGWIDILARMLDENGQEERRFSAEAQVRAADVQTVNVGWDWPDARRWDFGRPNLYTLQLRVRGRMAPGTRPATAPAVPLADIDDEYRQRFGFREFRVEGRSFYLNDVEIRLRPSLSLEQWSSVAGTIEVHDGLIDGQMAAGYNIEEHWPVAINARGTPNYRYLRADRADRKGWLLMGGLVRINEFINDRNHRLTWDQPGVRQRWENAMVADLKRMRNHPSIVMWSMSANRFGFAQDQNPVMLGRGEWPRNLNDWQIRSLQYAREALEIIRAHDPTRPVYNHHGGYIGDVHTINMYLCLLPLQEREEWPGWWAQHGKMPFMAIEFGTPLHCTFMRGRTGFADNIQTEPLMTEFCAVYLGRSAYETEPAAYRAEIRNRFIEGQKYRNWQGNEALETAPAFQAVQHLFSLNTWRSWRTWGVTGGMLPWNMGHGWWGRTPEGDKHVPLPPFEPGRRGTYFPSVRNRELNFLKEGPWKVLPGGHAIMAANGPTLAWIAGPPEAFTAKDHHFSPGQRVAKQVVLINDTREAQKAEYAWTVRYEGVVEGEGGAAMNLRLEPAQTRRDRIGFEIPATMPANKVNARVRLTASIGGRKHEDEFAFRVYAPATMPAEEMAIFDPRGLTTKMLRSLGARLRPWTGESSAAVVLIGREALSGGHALPADLEAYVRGGGRAVVFAQHPDFLRRRGLRVAQHLSRRVFPVSPAHPVTAGLDAADLRDWTGESTLVEAYPDYFAPGTKLGAHGVPYYGWHWGNRHAVSSAPVEKPHRSGWRPILECEFDLAYTPLMELDWGRGRVILCTLDLEDHVPADPAAAHLAAQLLRYALSAPLRPRAGKVLLLGDDNDAARVDALGAIYERARKPDPSAQLLIVGANPPCDEAEIFHYLHAGGSAFYLPRRNDQATLGVLRRKAKDFAGSLKVPSWEQCAGLSSSDLRFRTTADWWVIMSGADIGADGLLARHRVGAGTAVFCQLDPDALDADRQTFFRYTRWRQTRAMSQILANMGASFADDGAIFGTRAAPRLYHPDWRDDFELGDDPYRYYRW